MRVAWFAVAGFVLAAVSLWAQAPAKPLPAKPAAPPAEPTPRWPDGRVNLGSTPDHKGYWEMRPGGNANKFPRAQDMPLQPWARALQQYRASRTDLYPPLVLCKPGAGPSFFNSPGFEIVDVPELQKVFILNIAGPHSWREIYLDGRAHPTGPNLKPTYLGHSVGKWEGDTLVIDTVNFNEKQWVQGSYPNTEQLHMVERISRPNLRTLVYEVTVDDPGALTAAWTGSWTITSAPNGSAWVPDGEIFEYICQDAREN